MIRVTFELLPGGDAAKARTIGLMEISNIRTRLDGTADYAVVMKKTPPFAGALRAAWRKGLIAADGDLALSSAMATNDEELIVAVAEGFHRVKRGVYDLLFRALRACGMEERNRR